MDELDSNEAKGFVHAHWPNIMQQSSARGILIVCALQFLLIGVSAAPFASGLNPLGDFERMDAALADELILVDYESILSVIYQRQSEVTSEYRN